MASVGAACALKALSEVRSTRDDQCADSLLPQHKVALSRGATSEETVEQEVAGRMSPESAMETRK